MQVSIFNLPPDSDEATVREMLDEFGITDVEHISVAPEHDQSVSAVVKLSRPSANARSRHGEVLWRGHQLIWHVSLMFQE
ncbi:MAG: hypothetical protein FWD77_05160 [Betaproteobacteria bacterium]|nr:hypothetical protein [Betaproteobacteria bacterium]